MLSTNKQTMDQNLKALYDVLQTAAEYSFLSTSYSEIEIDGLDGNLANEIIENDKKNYKETSNLLNKEKLYNPKAVDTSKKFAEEFVAQLKKGKFLETISDEIDKHIKSIKLMISVPTLLPTIISPMGPCTGALTISEETGAQIQLL